MSFILTDRVIFSNVEAYRASKTLNLEFGCSHPFPANWRGTKFRELSQEALLAEVKDTPDKNHGYHHPLPYGINSAKCKQG